MSPSTDTDSWSHGYRYNKEKKLRIFLKSSKSTANDSKRIARNLSEETAGAENAEKAAIYQYYNVKIEYDRYHTYVSLFVQIW